MNKDSRSYIVVGGASGIGKAVVLSLLRAANNVILLSRDPEKIAKLKAEISDLPGNLETLVCDAKNAEEVRNISEQIKTHYGLVDGLVNAAGESIPQQKSLLDIQVFNQLLEQNLNTVYIPSMVFGYSLIKNSGAIVNVSSIRGRTGTDSFSAGYAAAKAGVINFTKTFALEMADKNIRVNCVAPGLTYPTELSKNWTQEFRDSIAKSIPLKRLASPSDISNVIEFLLSEKSSYMTGQTVDVNGGLFMN